MVETKPLRRGMRRNCSDCDRFQLGRWVTGGTARQMATEQSRTDVVAALTSICLDQSKRDPQLAEWVALLKAASSYERSDIVMKNGWATMPGTSEGNRLVAVACADKVGVEAAPT